MAVDMDEVRKGKGIAHRPAKPLEKVTMQLGDMNVMVLKRDESEYLDYGYRTLGPWPLPAKKEKAMASA
jgi:hypothetical protein